MTGVNLYSDNIAPIAPEFLAALIAANQGTAPSYGADPYTARLTQVAREVFETDLAIIPVATGTAANALALATLAPPFGGVYCSDCAHINTDECGAPEFYSAGAKLIGLPAPDGKLRPAQLAGPLATARGAGVHHVQPAALSLTRAPSTRSPKSPPWPRRPMPAGCACTWTARGWPTPSPGSAARRPRSPGRPAWTCSRSA